MPPRATAMSPIRKMLRVNQAQTTVGHRGGSRAPWVKVTRRSFAESQPPPHCVGRAGRRDRGCGIRAQGLTQREGCPRGGLVGDRVRRQRPCSNPKAPKGLKAGALIFRGTREKLNEALGFS